MAYNSDAKPENLLKELALLITENNSGNVMLGFLIWFFC